LPGHRSFWNFTLLLFSSLKAIHEKSAGGKMKKTGRNYFSTVGILSLLILLFTITGCATTMTMTPLTQAARDGDVVMINKLLNEGAKIDEPNPGSWNAVPLIWSLESCKRDTAKLLLDKGARINVLDSDGMSSLSWALAISTITGH